MAVRRFDKAELGKASRTPQGGLRVNASLTRSGIFEYTRADGTTVKEYRPDDEVFSESSLSSLPGAPVTLKHPPEMVRADNFPKYSKGHVGDSVIRDGERVSATLYVQDGTLVSAIERGDMREVSCGYTCDVEETTGTAPDGTRYDAVQRNIQYNHVAIVPKGRAGSSVRLHLDAEGHESITQEDQYMERNDEAAKVVEELGAVKAERDALKAKLDEADAAVKKLEADIKELPAKMKARADLETKAAKVLGSDIKFDAMSDEEIRAKVIDKAFESVSAAVETEQKPVKVSKVETKNDENERDARAEMLDRNRKAWQ